MDKNGLIKKDRSLLIVLAGIVMTFLPLFAIEYSLLKYTGGVFMYPLDDTFIHMDLARNLAEHNTWGINPGEFGSASSSILYTIILFICFKIFSVHIIIPFLINCVAAVLLIIAVQGWMNKRGIPASWQLLILFLLVFIVPLPILIMSGMEHSLQCLFSFLFLFSFSDWLEKMKQKGYNGWGIPWKIIVYGMLVSTIRYEGLFLVAIACAVLLYHKKLWLAIQLGLISMLPLAMFGIYSMSRGSYFLPNSVLIKSETGNGGILSLINTILVDKLTLAKTITALATQRLLIILPMAFLLFYKPFRKDGAWGWILSILFLAVLLHLSFASTGWFYRYEAYLILCAFIILPLLALHHGKNVFSSYDLKSRLMFLAMVFFLFFPFVLRSMAAFTKAKQACVNIYEQQYQMGRFLKEFNNNEVVAANDIGAVSYFHKGMVIDLWGLGSIDVAKSRRGKYWDADFLDSFSKKNNTGLAIVYDSWFNDSLLNRWSKVATWKIQNNVICGDDIVSFYVLDPAKAPGLKEDLQAFQLKMPPGVEIKYFK